MRLLIDEMFPPATARLLRDERGLDVVHVADIGLRGADDAVVADVARAERRAVVTENVGDFAREEDLTLVCIRKRDLPAGGAQATALADVLARWVAETPEPYVGQHWPT